MGNSLDKSKDCSDSSHHSNKRKRSVDLYRKQYEESQRRQEASSSHHAETPSYSPDKLLPSKRMMQLENGTSASARDIEHIEDLRALADPLKNYGHRWNKQALLDLEMKCKDSTYQLSNEDSREELKRRGLINEEGQPSDSVKNILRDLRERGCLFDKDEPLATQVKLRNGTEEHYNVVGDVMSKLEDINNQNSQALCEFYKLCQDSDYALKGDTTEILKARGLINEQGQPEDAAKNIVLCSFDEQSRQLHSPAMRMYETPHHA